MKHLVNLTLVCLILAVASAVIINVPSADASTAATAGTATVAPEAGKTPKPKQLLRKALKGSKKAKPTKRVAGRTTPLPLKGSAADRDRPRPRSQSAVKDALGGRAACTGASPTTTGTTRTGCACSTSPRTCPETLGLSPASWPSEGSARGPATWGLH